MEGDWSGDSQLTDKRRSLRLKSKGFGDRQSALGANFDTAAVWGVDLSAGSALLCLFQQTTSPLKT